MLATFLQMIVQRSSREIVPGGEGAIKRRCVWLTDCAVVEGGGLCAVIAPDIE